MLIAWDDRHLNWSVTMKKIAAIALSLSVLTTAAFAQDVPVVDPLTGAAIAPGAAPTVVVAGGVAGASAALALIPLVLLAAVLGGSSGTPGS